ncbi:MAG: hypothetical protein JJT96_06285 [Opitutales bacterium]|nr:hypothetical protein [Opitutales bacterium]
MLLLAQAKGELDEDITAGINLTNNAPGVNFDSLRLDSGFFGLIHSAYGVSNIYQTPQDLVNSGQVGYSITGDGSVYNGWNSVINSDLTVSLNNLSSTNPNAIPGGDYDQFSTGKNTTGFFFANKGLLNIDNNVDGQLNYDLVILDENGNSNHPNFASPLTKTGIVGSSLGGNFAEAYAGIDTFSAPGQAYALVPTDYHPQIPEPAAYASVLGALALAGVMYRRRRASGGKIVRSA